MPALEACPRCGSRAVVTEIAPPAAQRDPPHFLACRKCGIERADLRANDETEHAPVPPCPSCGRRELRAQHRSVVQLTLFGPPIAARLDWFICAGCGIERDDLDEAA
jgi:hypothetical protein